FPFTEMLCSALGFPHHLTPLLSIYPDNIGAPISSRNQSTQWRTQLNKGSLRLPSIILMNFKNTNFFFFTRKGINTNSYVYKYLRLICQYHDAITPGVGLELTSTNYKLAALPLCKPDIANELRTAATLPSHFETLAYQHLYLTPYSRPPQQKGFHWDICIAY